MLSELSVSREPSHVRSMCDIGGAITHIAMTTEMLQELDFTQGAFCKDLLAKDIGDLLDSYAFAGLVVGGSAAEDSE